MVLWAMEGLKIFSFHSELGAKMGALSHPQAASVFARPLASVPELEAVLQRAARLTSRSALYGICLILRVASSGADTDFQ